MKMTARFRELVQAPEILMLPVAHDGLSALAIAEAGFSAMSVAGYGTAGSQLGLPDIGVLSSTEMLTQYAHIVDRVEIPVMVDIDTGFGDVNNVIHAVRQVERLGAAALFLEDQTYPKRCGHMAGKSVVPVEEYLPKLKAALWARQDPDFVIMARTDAAAVHGLDEAVRRAQLYAAAGADMVFVEAVTSVEDMRKVNAAVPVPSMANMIEGGRTPFLTAEELQDVGYAVVAYPCASVCTAVTALRKWAAHLKFHGTSAGFAGPDTMVDFEEYFRFIGAAAIRERRSYSIQPKRNEKVRRRLRRPKGNALWTPGRGFRWFSGLTVCGNLKSKPESSSSETPCKSEPSSCAAGRDLSLGGVAWDYLQYLHGFYRLGHDVYYLEDTAAGPTTPSQVTFVEDMTYHVQYLREFLERLDPGLAKRYCVIDPNGRHFGLSAEELAAVVKRADVFINISTTCQLREAYAKIPVKVLIDSDRSIPRKFSRLHGWHGRPGRALVHRRNAAPRRVFLLWRKHPRGLLHRAQGLVDWIPRASPLSWTAGPGLRPGRPGRLHHRALLAAGPGRPPCRRGALRRQEPGI
jgi:methylisocitrate lyase